MGKYIIAKPYSATVNAQSSEVSGMDADNLLLPYPSDVWRTTGDTAEHVIIDLGSAKAVNLIALMFTNLTSAATWRVRAGTTTSVTNYDSTAVTAWAGATENVDRPHAMLFLSSAQTYRYWRIDLADSANPDTFIEAGRVILANAFQGSRNYSYGAGRGFNDLSTKQDSFGGGLLYETKAKRPVLTFETANMTAAEIEATILELQRLNDGPVFAMLDPDANTYRMGRMYYGLMELAPVINTTFNRFSTRITVEGLI